MSNVQITDLKNQIDAGKIVVHSGTYQDIVNEINKRSGTTTTPTAPADEPLSNSALISAYFATKTTLFNAVQAVLAITWPTNYPYNGTHESQLAFQQTELDKKRKLYTDAKKKFTDFLTISRNSSIPDIRNDASSTLQNLNWPTI